MNDHYITTITLIDISVEKNCSTERLNLIASAYLNSINESFVAYGISDNVVVDGYWRRGCIIIKFIVSFFEPAYKELERSNNRDSEETKLLLLKRREEIEALLKENRLDIEKRAEDKIVELFPNGPKLKPNISSIYRNHINPSEFKQIKNRQENNQNTDSSESSTE